MNKEKQLDLFYASRDLMCSVLLLRTQLENFQRLGGSLTKYSNRGNLDMEKLKQLVSGCEAYLLLNQLELLTEELGAFITKARVLTVGKTEAEHIKE